MKKTLGRGRADGHPLITQDDPLLMRFNQIERLLHQLIQRSPTEHQLRALIQQEWDRHYRERDRELNDLRDECVRLLAVLREKAKTSPPISQRELNG